MRKTLRGFILIIVTILFVTCTWSQSIYKSGSYKSYYAGKINPAQSPVEQDVYKTFAVADEVMVIDFSKTALKAPPPLYENSANKFINHGEFFAISNKAAMQQIVSEYPASLTMVFPFNKKTFTIDLVRSDIFADDFKVITNESGAKENVQTGAYYKGIIRGERSLVAISFFPSHTEGIISISGKPAIELGKMQNSEDDNIHIVYSTDNLLSLQKFVCNTAAPLPGYLKEMESMQKMPQDNADKIAYKCVTEYWETSYNIYQKFKTTQHVTDFVTSLFNGFAAVFANERIGMRLKATHIWTKADPYLNSLDSFSKKRSSFNANLALLLSTTGGGGVAWINSVCRKDVYYNHSFCGSVSDKGSPLPTFSWPIEVTTHETGHNLGSPHTHACAWNGNHTAIDGCGPAAGYNEGCTGPLPIKGSIMSYCHLVSSVGIDLALGFGQQPGDLIRNKVASCITLKCSPSDTTCNPPADLVASNIKATNARITWTGVTGSIYYYVYVRRSDTLGWTLAADKITTKYFVLTNLTAHKKYFVQVGVACKNGQSLSSQMVFTTASSFIPNNEINVTTKDQKNIQVIPNPAYEGKFVVNLSAGMENAAVQIVSYAGKTITTNNQKGLNRTFNIPGIKGLYFAKVINGTEVNIIKIMLQ